jgi:vancomycin permeability regulator SanA
MFFLINIFLLLNVFRGGKSSPFSYKFLLFVSVISIFSLIASQFSSQKDYRLILSGFFIVSNIFILSSLAVTSFSKTNKYSFFKSIFLMLFIFVGGISTVFILVLNFADNSDLYSNVSRKADAGVILGAAVWGGNRPSPVLRERINKGYDIYAKGIVPKLVITGGGSPNEMTEAQVSKNLLIKYGVNPENLLIENESNSTIEQIQFVKNNLYKSNNWHKIILISDNFHLMRAKEISNFNNIEADCISSDKSLAVESTFNFCLKESLALIFFWMLGV